jgi:hypothetical protein
MNRISQELANPDKYSLCSGQQNYEYKIFCDRSSNDSYADRSYSTHDNR